MARIAEAHDQNRRENYQPLAEESVMTSLPKTIGVLSCAALLCLSLVDASQAFRIDPCASRKGGLPNLVGCSQEAQQGIQTIKGVVQRVDGDTLIVERFNGQEVELPIAAVRNGHVFEPGDWIEAKLGPVAGGEKQVLAVHDISGKEAQDRRLAKH